MSSDTSLQEIGPVKSLLTICFCIASSVLIYSLYIHITGKTDGYIAKSLSDWHYIFPQKLLPEIEFGGFKGALVITTVKSFNVLIYTSIFGFLAYIATKLIRKKINKEPEDDSVQDVFKNKKEYVSPQEKTKSKILVHDLVASDFEHPDPINLGRSDLKVSRPPKNLVEHLELAIHKILHKYQNVPSDTEGAHHGGTLIYKHTLFVTDKIVKALPEEPLARVIGLAHDIGKILAYKKNEKPGGKEWVQVTNKHEQLSAQVIRMLPEYEALKNSDKESATIINAVLTYAPYPAKLPIDLQQPRIQRLIKQLKIADGHAVRAEQDNATQQANSDDVVEAVSNCLTNILVGLNINSYIKSSYADGWTNPAYDYLAVMDEAIRRNLAGAIPQRIAEKICLNMPYERGKRHPATATILEAFKRKGLLLEEYEGLKSDNGLFAIRASKQRFYGVYLLDREKLEHIIPDQLKHWGNSEYSIKVIGHSDEKLRPSRKVENEDEEI